MNTTNKKNANNDNIINNLAWKADAAQSLHVSPRTLDRWHTERRGPPRFLVGGRICYDQRDIVAWLEEQKAKTALY